MLMKRGKCATDLENILAIGQLLVGERLAVDGEEHVADTHTVPLTKGHAHPLVLKLELDVQGKAVGLNRGQFWALGRMSNM